MQTALPPRQELLHAVRGAAGQMASGVAIVIAMRNGAPHSATASSGVVASLDPPLLALFFSRGSRMHDALTRSGRFTANLLRQSDHALARRFSNPARASGWPSLAGLDLLPRDPAPPLLASAAAWFDCRLHQTIETGDHTCFLGEITDCGRDPDAPRLLYYRGRLHALGPPAAPPAWTTLTRDDLGSDW